MQNLTEYPPVNACIRLIDKGVIPNAREVRERLLRFKFFDDLISQDSVWLSGTDTATGKADAFTFEGQNIGELWRYERDLDMQESLGPEKYAKAYGPIRLPNTVYTDEQLKQAAVDLRSSHP